MSKKAPATNAKVPEAPKKTTFDPKAYAKNGVSEE